MNQFFETTMPEAVGIQSEHIKNFIEKLEAYDLCMTPL